MISQNLEIQAPIQYYISPAGSQPGLGWAFGAQARPQQVRSDWYRLRHTLECSANSVLVSIVL